MDKHVARSRSLVSGIALVAILIATHVYTAAASAVSPAMYQDMRWRLIGPFLGGRTVAITGIPTQPNVAYAGAVDGGVWRTTDYGQTWTPIFDGQPTQSIGAIAIAPSDPKIIYVGSGEGLRRPDLSTGNGVYKSVDGGVTWIHLGLRDSQQIGAIAVDPADPNRVFVAAFGHPYGPNTERGVYRSLDGGATWKRVLYKDANTGAIALEFDPSDARNVYAVLFTSRRGPWHTGGAMSVPGSGLYVSHDRGDTWAQLTRGLPGTAQHVGRIGIAIAPSAPQRMYALVDADPGYGGLYRSDDAGVTWHKVNGDERIWGRGEDFACVRVDPLDPDRVYVADVSTYRSDDAGASFTAIKGAPGGDDYHTIWINPLHPEVILIACDQGATISVNGGATWSSWYTQPTAQYFHVTTDDRFPYRVYGAEQESGSTTIASRSDYGEITFRDWHSVGIEEYGYIAVDPLDDNIIYGGKAQRFDMRTGQVQDISPNVLGDYRYDRTAPMAFSPVDPHALYLGSNVLFETIDGGHSWRTVSPDLTRPHPPIPAVVGPFAPRKTPHGVIYSIGLSHKDARVIWAGTDDGLIWRTSDGGAHWHDVTPKAMVPWLHVMTIEPSHFDDQTVYAAVSGFRIDDLHPYIYATHDGGASWTLIARGLADDASVNVVREDPERRDLLYAGTENGVYVSFDRGAQWLPLQLNLPRTSVRDLDVHDDDLIVATHGRSFWILDDVTPLRQASPRIGAGGPHLFAPEPVYRVRHARAGNTPLPPEVPAGQNPPDGAILDYYLPNAASLVAIDVLDAHGALVRHYSSAQHPSQPIGMLSSPTYWYRKPMVPLTSAGMHRFVWDLRYATPEAVHRGYAFGAVPHDTILEPAGSTAVPGSYTVRLTVDGRSSTESLIVRADPRMPTTPAGYEAELALGENISTLLDRSYRAWQAAVKSKSSHADDLAEINDELAGLSTNVDDADRAPTVQQVAAVAKLRAGLDALLKKM